MSRAVQTPRTGQPARPGAQDQQRRQQELQRTRERRLLGLVALAVVVLVVGGGLGLQQYRTSRRPTALPATSTALTPVAVVAGRPIVLGDAEAPVRVKLYEDFHCPHCADFEETFGPTLTAAQQDGRVAVALYPMAFIDAGSTAAANAMACAAEAGFGQDYYLSLFANHTLAWHDSQLTALAAQLRPVVPASFGPCVTDRAHSSWVTSINTAAAADGVTGTPTMSVGDTPVDIAALTPQELGDLIARAAKA